MKMGKRLESIKNQVGEEESLEDLKKATEELEKKINEWQSKVIELRMKGFQDALNWPAGMNSEFFMIRNNLDTYDPSIPEGYKTRFNDLSQDWNSHKQVLEELMENEVKEYNKLYESKKLPALEVPETEKLSN